MITLDDIRRLATAFPEVEEIADFGQPSCKVRGKPGRLAEVGRRNWHEAGGPPRVLLVFTGIDPAITGEPPEEQVESPPQ